MALDVASFVARFPEWDDVGDVAPGAITTAIADATHFCDAGIWGSRYEAGVMYKAADLLAQSPFGEHARLEKGSNKTTYGETFRDMQKALPIRGLLV